MEPADAASALAALAHEGRLALFRLLVRRLPGRVTPSELAASLALSPSLASAQLAVLSRAGLVSHVRRGKSLRYRAEIERLDALARYLVEDCCRGRPALCSIPTVTAAVATGDSAVAKPFNVLFVCTRNAARSQMAESIVRHRYAERFRAFSAGTLPADGPHPAVLALLEASGHDVAPLRSKSVDEFLGDGAPRMDFVFTVCDRAAAEECARWPGGPVTAHWGVPDPLVARDAEAGFGLALRTAFGALERRFATFAALPLESLDRMSLQREVDAIGGVETAGATEAVSA